MPEIRLVKRYPHIKDEDVTSIFQEGYIKGFENGRKGAIPIEWILNKYREKWEKAEMGRRDFQFCEAIHDLLEMWDEEKADWEKENEID